MVGISRNMIALNSLNWRNYNSRSFFSEEYGYDKIFDRKMELLLYGEADYYDRICYFRKCIESGAV